MQNKFFGIWLFIISVFFSVACNQKNAICLEPQIVAMKNGFYYNSSDTSYILKDSFLTNANIIFGNDTLYLLNIKNQSKYSNPLSSLKDTTTLFFQADSSLTTNTDTIKVIHQNELHFISVACGYQLHYTIQQILYTKNTIDSIIIATNQVTNEVTKEHLKIVLSK